MGKWTREEGKETLAAISMLKRALGISNHAKKMDEIIDKRLHIYFDDESSANLVAELMYSWATGNRKARYDKHLRGYTLRDTIEVVPLAEGGFTAAINAPFAPSFVKGINKIINKHISPDNSFIR